MSHGMGATGLVLTGVLLWTVSSALGWIGLPPQTGIAGVHDDAWRSSGATLPATDAIFFSPFAFQVPPALTALTRPRPLARGHVPVAAVPPLPTRGPPGPPALPGAR